MQNFRFSGTLKSLDFREKFRIMSLTCFALLQTILKPAPKRVVGNSMGRVHVIIFWNNTFSSILNISHCTSYTSTSSSRRSLQARLGPSYQTRLSLQNDTLCAVVQSCTFKVTTYSNPAVIAYCVWERTERVFITYNIRYNNRVISE